MKKLKGLTFVTAIVAFSQAKVGIKENPVAGVYILSKQNLLTELRSLG